mgnify:CR=1 FL=1
MKTKLISIGNSKGIRIPAALIREAGLEYEIDLQIEKDGLKIKPLREARHGWDKAFAVASSGGADTALIDDGLTNEFDDEEWVW